MLCSFVQDSKCPGHTFYSERQDQSNDGRSVSYPRRRKSSATSLQKPYGFKLCFFTAKYLCKELKKRRLFSVILRIEIQISKIKGLDLLRNRIYSQQLINFLSAV